MITRSLSPDTMLLEDAETEIKLLVKRLFLRGANRADIQAAVQKYIRETLKKLKNHALAADAYVSLFKLANRAYNDLLRTLGADGAAVAVAVGLALKGKLTPTVGARVGFNGGVVLGDIPEPIGKGVPLQVYSKEYMKRVNAAMLRLARERAIDPNDLTGRNSLRNLAEMETRYKSHEDEINGFREKGVNLVVISTHADCSDRCFPYQGRVYSLDGTRGKTEDGREYVPLEEATQNPRDLYTTKAGRTYQNGLFGFNCFDDKTEVFTDKGWKLFAEMDGTEKIYTLSPETRETEWQKSLRFYVGRYEGEMVWLHNQSTDLMCTPNHDLLYFTQKDSRLRFKEAKDFSTATFLYAGQQWKGEEADVIELGGKKVDAKLYCRFMAYYLADGSRHAKTAVKIAQRNNEKMFEELQGLPFKVWRDNDKIVIHNKSVADELAQYGTAAQKYVPPIIKTLSRGLICEFLDAYLKTDGYVARQKKASGFYSEHKSLFTTSEQMANDLGELAIKAGYRPKFDKVVNKGKTIAFRNGEYALNHDLFVVHMNKRVNITHLKKDVVHYNGFIFCVEVPNHTLLVRRNGRVVWCGNCRHKAYEYRPFMRIPKVSREMQQRENAINTKQREYERAIRNKREIALFAEDKKIRQKARQAAVRLNEEYIAFSKKNGRAYYPDRVKILFEK